MTLKRNKLKRNGVRSFHPTICPNFGGDRQRGMQNSNLKANYLVKVAFMTTFVLTLVFAMALGCATLLDFPVCAMAAAQGTESARLTAGPELEMASENAAIIRWTTTNPGGTALHFGIVHYGTDPANLTQLAKSPNRRNPSHPDMIFRVRIAGLNRATTYYYTIESTGSTGVSDAVSSPVRTFKTR